MSRRPWTTRCKVPEGRRRTARGFNPWTTATPIPQVPEGRRHITARPRGVATPRQCLRPFRAWCFLGDLDLGLKPQALFLRPLWGLPDGAWLARDSARFLGAPQISRPDHRQRQPKPPTAGGAPAVPGSTDGAGRFLHQEAATAAHPRAPPTHLRRWHRLPSRKRRTPAERRRPWTRRPSSLQIVNERKEDPAAFLLQGEGLKRPVGRGDPRLASSFVSLHFRESLRAA